MSAHPGDPFVFIFLMAHSMHNDLSRRIQRLLLRAALNNAAAPSITEEVDERFSAVTDEPSRTRPAQSPHSLASKLLFFMFG